MGYQQRDFDVVDYEEYRLTNGFVARGPAPLAVRPNEYFACVGAAQTFGPGRDFFPATAPNRVFGTKIISHFLMDHLKLAAGLARDLAGLQYVHIVRKDRIGQAISAMLAEKTGIWHVRTDEEHAIYQQILEQLTITNQDLDSIRWLMEGFERQELLSRAVLCDTQDHPADGRV